MSAIISLSVLRREMDTVLNGLAEAGDVVITQHGRPTAVLLDFARYEALMTQLEDLTDLVSLGKAVNEPARPYEQFLAELAG
ncbi:MAG TPA: type II toxin-antitoxin system prevent-host-death family antitoxin [Chloroflexi bacterium]|nr:type II toxin-antitoxin system prevent-host-death family antitoxin [Chloroflexota bacterium]